MLRMSPRKLIPSILAAVAFIVCLWTVPAAWCRRGAEKWISGDLPTQLQLARTVVDQLHGGLSLSDYKTGTDLFNGEWLFGTHLMTGIGLCQVVLQHPGTAKEFNPAIEKSIEALLSPEVQAFDELSWNGKALETLETDQGHAAYLGYLNFLLSLYRQINPANPYAELNDKITATLVRRVTNSPSGLIATYPGEWYPVDNTPVIASIAINQQATGQDHSKFLARQEKIFREKYIDPQTGLLIQAVGPQGDAVDAARGSGSALGVFFLHHAYPQLCREIFDAIRTNLETDLFSFGAIREYPHGTSGRWDVDSGPIVFGFGFSATGFTISATKAFQDDRLFARLYSSAILAGAPSRKDGRIDFLTAGPLGNAILLAMFTTRPLP